MPHMKDAHGDNKSNYQSRLALKKKLFQRIDLATDLSTASDDDSNELFNKASEDIIEDQTEQDSSLPPVIGSSRGVREMLSHDDTTQQLYNDTITRSYVGLVSAGEKHRIILAFLLGVGIFLVLAICSLIAVHFLSPSLTSTAIPSLK